MRIRREYVSLLIVAAVLVASIVVVHRYATDIRAFIEAHTIAGVAVYLLLNIVDAVVAPGATLPLIPVVARAWGHVPAALATTAGWTAGSLVAFLIARRWGMPIVKALTSVQRVRSLARFIPDDLFWTVALLRALLPMDVVSYVLGLFTDMTWPRYAAATAIGLTPSAFVLAYIGRTPHAYTILMIVVAAAVAVSLVLTARRRVRR